MTQAQTFPLGVPYSTCLENFSEAKWISPLDNPFTLAFS
jgi:hypothetical protein